MKSANIDRAAAPDWSARSTNNRVCSVALEVNFGAKHGIYEAKIIHTCSPLVSPAESPLRLHDTGLSICSQQSFLIKPPSFPQLLLASFILQSVTR